MDKKKARVSKRGGGSGAHGETNAEASTPVSQHIYIKKCNNAQFSIHGGKEGAQVNDMLNIVTTDVLQHGEETLFSLEQEICEKLRTVNKFPLTNFEDYFGFSFKQFLQNNASHFNVTLKGSDFVVSLVTKTTKKKKKKKKTRDTDIESNTRISKSAPTATFGGAAAISSDSSAAHDSSEEQWQDVRPRKTGKKSSQPLHDSQVKPTSLGKDKGTLDTLSRTKKTDENDDAFIENLLVKPSDNSLMFRESEEVYDTDVLQFTIDIVSMWNVPRRQLAYIILGVRPNMIPPHLVKGIKKSKSDFFYQAMFKGNLFDPRYLPKYSYREANWRDKRMGIIQIESSQGSGSPCIVISDEETPTLAKDQLWVRHDNQTAPIALSHPLTANIFWWCSSSSPVGTPMTSSIAEEGQPNRETSTPAGPQATASPSTISPARRLLMSLNSFKKGHFVLVCGSKSVMCRNVEALANAPWIAVYDFDYRGRDTGFLANMEGSIKSKRSLSVLTWCDSVRGITEKGTQWWSLRGRRDVHDSFITEDSNKEWVQRVRRCLEKICQELARFSEDYTILTLLVLWPNSQIEGDCIHKFLSKLQEFMRPKVIICFTDPETNHADSIDVQMIQRNFGEDVQILDLSLGELCSEIELDYGASLLKKFNFQLPSSDKSNSTLISDEDAAWLVQELDILYLKSPFTERDLTAEMLREEGDNFFRGGTLNWYVWYDAGPDCFVIERSISSDITKHVKDSYIDKCRGGTVTVLHAPGSGGSTMAQRVLWDLHEVVPCVQVKQRSGSPMEEIAARLNFLYEKTHLPVCALMDGEDEARLRQLCTHLRHNYVIILHVKRYPYFMTESRSWIPKESKFYLHGVVTKQESRNLELRLRDRCLDDEQKIKSLKALSKEIQEKNAKHYMYEFGMSVYAHEFKGIRAFVRGYLQLEQNKGNNLLPWQKCLAVLALVYYYGQSSMPCQFFASLLGNPPSYKLDKNDLPFPISVFIVPDSNESRRENIRIGHYTIAKEILEQVLNRSSQRKSTSDRLSKEAKRNLKDFCLDFIGLAANRKTKTSLTAQTIIYILTKTFIFRDDEISDIATQPKHKPTFSKIIYDIDSDAPYNGRLEVLQQLCKSFPDDPNFRAHLGRFYACCRPEEESEVEKHFEEAIRLCNDSRRGKDLSEMEDGLKFTLMHIYHMYGIVFQRRVEKYTGRNPRDVPEVHTDETHFQERLEEIVQNAERACGYFVECRHYTLPGHEDSYKYVNEIFVRLYVCEFVRKNFKGGVQAFLTRKSCDSSFNFIKKSVTEIDDLIKECYNDILFDNNGYPLQKAVVWFHDIFQTCTFQLEAIGKDDNIAARRLRIMAKKLEFPHSDGMSLESNLPPDKVEDYVKLLEEAFCYESTFHEYPKSALELDYKDWITAIRNHGFRKMYSLEKVLEHVRHWYEAVRSPLSTYYMFVLLSIIGFGSSTQTGHTESLLEARLLLESMQRLSKAIMFPRYPREWLGRDDLKGIHRMVSRNTVGHVEDRCIKGSRTKLAVCKGTIRSKNDKALSGNIDLDLGENTTPVRVFFIPLLAKLNGTRYAGQRVQFHVAFSLEHGYEAFEVKLLQKYKCNTCHLKVEIKVDESEVLCPNCSDVIVISRTSSEEEL